MSDREFQIKQSGMVVSGSCGPGDGALAQAMHYAHVYAQDGPVEVQEKVNGRWRRFAQMREGGDG